MLVQVLYNRKVSDPREVAEFLAGRWPEADPFELRDMDRAVDIVIRSIRRRERIAVYGDFDTDGVTATALLVQTLTGLGADVQPYIPRRAEEGYGVNIHALRQLYKEGVRLVVTVDCGVRAVNEIDQARRGLEFIVTDHHDVGPELPRASAVIDPKREDCPYPFKGLAGVGVAFKLAQAVVREAASCGLPVHVAERPLLDLVALGTVADLAPLHQENRYLVKRGLEVLNEAQREGVRALLRVAGVRPGDVSAATIGFGLGPRLNATGRLDDALLSYRLLITCDPREAGHLAEQLNRFNHERQALTAQAYEKAEQQVLAGSQDMPLLFAADEEFQPGIVGLVAGRLTERYYRPAVIVERGDEICKGSCRSIPEFHITRALDECRDLLVRHGGHEAAAGFTVRRENLDALMCCLFQIAGRELAGKELFPALKVDAEVPLAEMNWAAVEWLRKLEPCGEGNRTPLFLSRDLSVRDVRTVGAKGQHLKLALGQGDQVWDAIAFHQGDRAAALGSAEGVSSDPGCVDVVYHLEVNEWNGEQRLQLNVQDMQRSEAR